jgi:N-acetylmuramoyl-L-alanine amidase
VTAVRRCALVAVLALVATACSVLDTSPAAEAPPSTGPAATTSTTAPLPVVAAPTTATTTIPVGPPRALVTPTGVVVPIRGGGPGSWVVGTPCHDEALIADGGPIHRVTVLIDPGHGGDDEPGAVGAGGLEEADLNLDVAWRLSAALAERGIDSALTRPTDYRIAVISRAELALAIRPRVFVSVHHNAGE